MKVKQSFFIPFEHPLDIANYDHVDCNLCGSAHYKLIGKELFFDIRECRDCGLVYVTPQPSLGDLPRFYEAMYPDETDESAQARTFGYMEPHLRRIMLKRYPEAKRVLDVGCGYGLLLKHLEDLPLELTGVEFSKTAVNYARRNVPKATIHQGDVENVGLSTESQDCIFMIAALEHVKDPHATLRRLHTLLAPGGLLVVQVPYSAPYLKVKRWLPWLPITLGAPAHLFDFSPKTLRRYFEETGFRDIHVEIARPYAGRRWWHVFLIWGIKLPGLLLYHLTARRYIYPFSSAIVCHGIRN